MFNKCVPAKFKIALGVLCVVFLSGCVGPAVPVQSDVQVFHTLPEDQAPAVYAFFDLDSQLGRLEHRAYKNLIRAKLAAYGHREIEPGEMPDALVSFSYGIDNGKEKITSTPDFVVGGHRVGTYTVYGRELRLWITSVPQDENLTPQVVYEATVKSAGSSSSLPIIMPSMVDALFQQFPGPPTQARRESSPLIKRG